MCDDITTTIDELAQQGCRVRGEPQDEGWGITATIVCPAASNSMLYEPRHRTAI